jgi:hypothetical protein
VFAVTLSAQPPTKPLRAEYSWRSLKVYFTIRLGMTE